MMSIVIGIHVIICIMLIIVVLIQAGRGGGLVENFSGIESMLGSKTNALLSRVTTVLSVLFFITCLSLALLSVRQSKSLMTQKKAAKPQTEETAKTPDTTAGQQAAAAAAVAGGNKTE